MKLSNCHIIAVIIVVLTQWCGSVVGQDEGATSPGTSTTDEVTNETCTKANDGTCAATTVVTESLSSSSVMEFPPLCADDGDEGECEDWAEHGECQKNPDYMLLHCRKSCNSCDGNTINWHLGEDLGEIQILDEGKEEEILNVIRATREYLNQTVYKDPIYDVVKNHCRNRDAACSYWVVQGECQNNEAFMNLTCAAACQRCSFLDRKQRCPMAPNATDIWQPGDLNNMFERIIAEPDFQQYEPHVLSRPDYAPGDTESNATYMLGPWVITLENILSEEEANRLIELGGEQGYERSGGVGKLNFDGTIESEVVEMRTSMNAWCVDACYHDPIAQQVMERIRNLTKIPDGNTEFLQLLRYEVGQFYKTHHDFIDYELDRPGGVRILTLFMYLNEVEEGGGTNFPELNLTVVPKRGRAVLWPSVLNDEPHKIDQRTEHQALPVEKGIKYGANAWMHQRDFKEAYDRNCS